MKRRANGQHRPKSLAGKVCPAPKPTHINFGTLTTQPSSRMSFRPFQASHLPPSWPHWHSSLFPLSVFRILRHSEAYKLPSLAFNFRLFQANAQTRLKCWRMARGTGQRAEQALGGAGSVGHWRHQKMSRTRQDMARNHVGKQDQTAFAYRTNRFNFTPRWHSHPCSCCFKAFHLTVSGFFD